MGLIQELQAINSHNLRAHNLHQVTSYTIPSEKLRNYVQELCDHANRMAGSTYKTVIEVADQITYGKIAIGNIKIKYPEGCSYNNPFGEDTGFPVILPLPDELLKNRTNIPLSEESPCKSETTPNCVIALQTLVEANARYVELTGRPQDAIAIHPRHARELLELFGINS